MRKHLISIRDLKLRDIERIYELAEEVKHSPESFQNALRARKFGLIFEKPSTRTWVSFDAGIFTLGGSTVYLGPTDIKLGEREEVRDVARVLDRYLAGIVMRTFSHETITEFERYFTRPVINGLSDYEHPCQALADYFTVREHFQSYAGTIMAYIGDGNNVLNSLLLLTARLGTTIHYATPRKHEPDAEILKAAREIAVETGAKIKGFYDPHEAVKDADAVYTDVWVSMGEEGMREEKLKDFDGFQVNPDLLSMARNDAVVMHCLPAHRGEEITDDIIEGPRSVVFNQAENRLHVQKAILLFLCA